MEPQNDDRKGAVNRMSSLRDELQAIYTKHGKLTPELVVEEARAEDSPLHATVFDRPANEAAEAWYRHRAQELIQSVKIKYRNGDREVPIRYFVSVERDGGHVYMPAEEVAQDELVTEIVLRTMEREWKQLQSRYGHFKEFAELVRGSLEKAA